MKKTILLLTVIFLSINLIAQESEEIYDTSLDGLEQIEKAIKMADESNKHILIQVGGNWCPWCIKFHHFVDNDTELKDIVESNYVVVLLNMSKENKNDKALARLDYPQRFGFPVFVILDQTGKRIHSQNSAYLEEGKSYNRDVVEQFFKHWTTTAIDPKSYKK